VIENGVTPASGHDDEAANAEPLRPLVIVADDHGSTREALGELLESVGIDTMSFADARSLLEADIPDRAGCYILDVRMPGASGLDLQHQLAARGAARPVVFLTGHGDVPMSIQAMKAGASDFLTKPVRDQDLLDAVVDAIERDKARREAEEIVSATMARFSTLSARERQVLKHVAEGQLNKQVAFELGVTEVTVKLHRGSVMKKMGAGSVAELVRMWENLPASVREQAAA
jgi:FixJ family two-component response regulator